MNAHDFPSATVLRTQCHLAGLLGRPVPEKEMTAWLSHVRQSQKLTERAACVLLVLAHSAKAVSFKDLEAALGVRHLTLTAVLGGLHDLGLVTGHTGTERSWERFVTFTETGKALVEETTKTNTCAPLVGPTLSR